MSCLYWNGRGMWRFNVDCSYKKDNEWQEACGGIGSIMVSVWHRYVSFCRLLFQLTLPYNVRYIVVISGWQFCVIRLNNLLLIVAVPSVTSQQLLHHCWKVTCCWHVSTLYINGPYLFEGNNQVVSVDAEHYWSLLQMMCCRNAKYEKITEIYGCRRRQPAMAGGSTIMNKWSRAFGQGWSSILETGRRVDSPSA